MTADAEGLSAALYQLTEHAERIGGLDDREARHYQEIGGRLSDLGTRVAGIGGTQADQAEILAGLEGLDEAVATLTERLDSVLPPDEDDAAPFYKPVPTPRWWVLEGEERDAAITRLRAWVQQVYRPSYGHISASLGRCWERHPLCLFTLDWLSELWSVLYLPTRSGGGLAGQAEWQTRLLPAAAEEMAIETSRCDHAKAEAPRSISGPAARRVS